MAGNKPPNLDHLGTRRKAAPQNQNREPFAPAGGRTQAAPMQAVGALASPAPGEYLLHATAPLVLGTGRPLDFGLGGETLDFPFPATVAGALRAALQVAGGHPPDPFVDPDSVSLHWLTLMRQWPTPEPLFARPADAAYLGGRLMRLAPEPVASDTHTDLPAGLQGLALPTDAAHAKPDPAPSWWTAAELSAWLCDPGASQLLGPYPVGDPGPKAVRRTHVVIDPGGRGAVEGGLFRSTGIELGGPSGYSLAVSCDAHGLHGAARRLGGEGRFVRFEAAPTPAMRTPPDAVRRALNEAVRVRVLLVTPAVFESGGWHPDWLSPRGSGAGQQLHGDWPGEADHSESAGLTLVAAAISRAQSYSGWQPAQAGQPAGPGRAWRVVPAGSVYWFDLPAGANALSLWGRSLCTGQWLRDGWGRCVVGTA